MNGPKEKQTYFLAKYALPSGVIHECQGQLSLSDRDYVSLDAYPFQLFRLRRDVFMTQEGAKKRVEQLRKRKIESLEKQMKALQEMQIVIETKTN